MDMQAAITEKTRRALWDLLAARDTVDNTLSKASEILAAAECFGINIDSDTFRSQDEIVRIEALIKQNATSARYPTVKSLITRLLDVELKSEGLGANPSFPSTEGDLVEKHDNIESDILVGPVIGSSRPKRNKTVVESDCEEDVSVDEDVPLAKRRRTARTARRTGSCVGWPQELFEKFAMYRDSRWNQKKSLLMKLWADGLKDGELQAMTASKACYSCQRTEDVCAVPPGVVGVRCLRCHAARPNSTCSFVRRPRGSRLPVASSEDDRVATSKRSTPTLKKETTHPAPIQQTIENIRLNGNMEAFLNQLRDALTK